MTRLDRLAAVIADLIRNDDPLGHFLYGVALSEVSKD